MPRTEEENQRIREEQKKNILEGAVRVFARKGFPATKMADIAAEATVSYGLVYHYFPNKEQVMDELLDWVLKKFAGVTQHVLEMPGTPLDRLNWLVSTVLQHLRQRPEDYMAFHQMIIEQSLHNSKWQDLGCKLNLYSADVMRRLIIEGQNAGQIAPGDPEQLVVVLQACIRGLAFCAITQKSCHDFPDTAMLLRLLRP